MPRCRPVFSLVRLAVALALAGLLPACDAGPELATDAQTRVWAAARDADLRLAEADVVFFVTPAAGAALDAGQLSAEDAARLLGAALQAEEAAFPGSVATSVALEARAEALLLLRATAAAAPTDSARAAARLAFEAAYARAYGAAGRSERDQAFAAQALSRAVGRAAAGLEAPAVLELVRPARRLVAHATAHAMRHAFTEARASDEMLQAIDAAAATWLDRLGQETTAAAFDRAHIEYNGFPGGLHTPLVLVSGVSSPGLSAAEAATLDARTALSDAVAASRDGAEVGRAVQAYYADARLVLGGTPAAASPLAVDGVLLSSASAGMRDGT